VAEIEYEPRDVNLRTVLKAGIGLGGITLFGAAAALGAFLLLTRWDDKRERPLPPLAHEPGRLPPEPRLQSAPQADIHALRAQERERLSAYGWVDAAGGVVHIPIDEAMRLYAERAGGRSLIPAAGVAGVPSVPAAAAGPSGTATMPGPEPQPSVSPSPGGRSTPR
jgi:hypothetical protein